jgi:CRISPR/Cas system-associated exonuclease Cas4 (RecB family)
MPALPRLRSPQTHIEARIHKALDKQRQERDEQYRAERAGKPTTLSLSGIGECPRKLWAGLHGIAGEPIPGGVLAIFRMGEAVERLVIEMLGRADFLVLRQQERVTIDFGDGVMATGRWDGVVILEHGKFRREEAVLEIKSANNEQFEQCEALGYDAWRPKYGDTLHSYMGASGIDLAIAVVLNKNNSRVYAEKIRFDPERYEGLKKKAEQILRATQPVPRPEEATSQYCQFCKYCDVAEWCHSSTADVHFDA